MLCLWVVSKQSLSSGSWGHVHCPGKLFHAHHPLMQNVFPEKSVFLFLIYLLGYQNYCMPKSVAMLLSINWTPHIYIQPFSKTRIETSQQWTELPMQTENIIYHTTSNMWISFVNILLHHIGNTSYYCVVIQLKLQMRKCRLFEHENSSRTLIRTTVKQHTVLSQISTWREARLGCILFQPYFRGTGKVDWEQTWIMVPVWISFCLW